MAAIETEKIKELRKLLASTSNPKQKAIYQMVLDAQLKLLEKESEQVTPTEEAPVVPSTQQPSARSNQNSEQIIESPIEESLLEEENNTEVHPTSTEGVKPVLRQPIKRSVTGDNQDLNQGMKTSHRESRSMEAFSSDEEVTETSSVVAKPTRPVLLKPKPRIKKRSIGSPQHEFGVRSSEFGVKDVKNANNVVDRIHDPTKNKGDQYSLTHVPQVQESTTPQSDHVVENAPVITEQKESLGVVEKESVVNPDEVTEVTTENLPDDAIYQAVGLMECEVYFTENNKAYILIDGNKYQLLYHKPRRKVFKALRKEIESTGNHFQRITVYPRVTHYPYYYQNDEIPDFANISHLQENGRQKYYYQIRFQLTGFYKDRKPRGIFDELGDREFMISGRWQYISICRIPCISIYKNFDEELLKDIKKMNHTRKALFLQSCHIPFRWENPRVKPLKTMGKYKTENLEETQPFFVKVKARFIPSENLFEVVEELETPTIQTPRFFKLYQREKHKSFKYQAQVKAQRMQSRQKNTTSPTETPETRSTPETTAMENLEKPPIKISVIEDDPMMVIAIKMVMEEDPQFSVISTSSTASDGVTDVQNVQPDVILLDLGLPDASGLDVAKLLRDSSEIPIIIFTTSEKDSEVREAFSVGANGYCVKGGEIEQLKTAILTVSQGNIYLDTKIAQAVIQQLNQLPSSETPSTLSTWVCPSGEVLKEQEIKILQLIADGQSNAEIGESLNLSVHTIKSYLKNIMQKMSAKNRAELAAMSVRSGLA